MTRFGIAALMLLLSSLVSAQPVEMVVHNARIATLDGKSSIAQALAVRDGKLVAVGGNAEVLKLAGPATRRIDAGGRLVVPGLIDSHMHAVRAALSYSTEVNWIGAASIPEAMARLKDKAAKAAPGSWLIVAGGWTEKQFAEKRKPTLEEVLAAAPDNPVWIQLFYAEVLVTPKAQTVLGLDPAKLPQGITVQPDGWWASSIVSLSALFDRLPKPSYEDNLAGTRQFMAELNRLGVTGVIDTGGFSLAAPQYAALLQLWREKAMSLRVAYHLFAQRAGGELEDFKTQTQLLPMGFGDDWLKLNGIGERITLALYNNNFPNDEVKAKALEALRWAAAQRMAVTVHWSENASVGHLLGMFEQVNAETPIAPLRWSIAHLEDASPETLARMAKLGVGWTTQIAMYYGGDRLLATRPDDARRMPPVASALKAGVRVAAGTDAHRVSSYNPFVALQFLVDGKTVSGQPMRGADELLSREQALRLYTQGSAWFAFDEHKRGTLEPGRLADFALLDQDILSVPAERIARTQSLLTVVGGRVVHAAAPFAR